MFVICVICDYRYIYDLFCFEIVFMYLKEGNILMFIVLFKIKNCIVLCFLFCYFYRYIFVCEEWLLFICENCKMWVELLLLILEVVFINLMLSENSCWGFFDDYLWFLFLLRLNVSKFICV